ncbi:MAG: hypothetical protein ABIO04_05400 [Ferruginibacter sp.]
MKRLTTIIRRPSGCLILLFIFLVFGCGTSPSYDTYYPTRQDSINKQAFIERSWRKIREIIPIIKNGDLVTRSGNDFTSKSFRSLNQRDQAFSHCGIASIENGTVIIYHALGGDFNPDQKIRRDPIELFAEPSGNIRLGIFRFSVPDSIQQNFVEEAKKFYKSAIMFDMDFDLTTNDRMYCAEFIYKTMRRASDNKLIFNHSHIKDFEFIGVDDLYLHPLCVRKADLVYK